ncbi:hypothetical protein Tco_0675048 [Tanacetum coccineum]
MVYDYQLGWDGAWISKDVDLVNFVHKIKCLVHESNEPYGGDGEFVQKELLGTYGEDDELVQKERMVQKD